MITAIGAGRQYAGGGGPGGGALTLEYNLDEADRFTNLT